jgi:hypothetical protein
MDKTIDRGAKHNKGALDIIWAQLKDTNLPSDPRLNLFYAYLSVELEHQEAILNLAVDPKLRGSAFALLRSQIEAGFRGLWVNKLSSEQEIDSIANHNGEPFPSFKQMAATLDAYYGAKAWIAGFADRWYALNGYTHTGLHQLAHRFRSDGKIGPAYTEEMVWELLTTSGTFSIGIFVPLFRTVNLEAKAAALEAWLIELGTPEQTSGD